MDKFTTLCWKCRAILADVYDIELYDASPLMAKKCEHCGKKFGLLYCRIRNKAKSNKKPGQ